MEEEHYLSMNMFITIILTPAREILQYIQLIYQKIYSIILDYFARIIIYITNQTEQYLHCHISTILSAHSTTFWLSYNKQKTVTLSSTEIEYMALIQRLIAAIPSLLNEIGFNVPTHLHSDDLFWGYTSSHQ